MLAASVTCRLSLSDRPNTDAILPPEGSLVTLQGPVRTREYERYGVRNAFLTCMPETISRLDRTYRQEPASGAKDLDE